MHTSPILADITRKMTGTDFGKTKVALAKLIVSTPEQHYRAILEEMPDLLQPIP